MGFTENIAQHQRWVVSGPEIERVLNSFKSDPEQIKKDQSK